jgi:hypothetical protein
VKHRRELIWCCSKGWLPGLLVNTGRASAMAAYEMWAGFVDDLARTCGWDTFNERSANGRGRAPGSADYRGISGKRFQERYTDVHAIALYGRSPKAACALLPRRYWYRRVS